METNALDSLLASVADSLDRHSLEALAATRASPEASARMEWLAGRANEGLLTEAERHEYQSAIAFSNFLGLLQSQAKLKLKLAA